MVYYIGDRKVEFSRVDLDDMYLDEGDEAIVYLYGDRVLKIYREKCRKARLDEENCLRLCKIPTKRIVLPEDPIYDGKHIFSGYSSVYHIAKPTYDYLKLKMRKFLSEIAEMREDADTLSEHHYAIYDLNMVNLIFSGSMYLVDPGSFQHDEAYPARYLKVDNRMMLSGFILNGLLGNATGKAGKRILKERYSDGEYLEEMLWEDAREDETVKQFVKRIVTL